jgi:hypothetical protein
MDSYVGKLVNFYCTKDEEKSQLKDLIYDFFIREINGIFNSLQNEELICKILSNLQTLNIEENLTSKSKVKLQDSIYSLTRPGISFFFSSKGPPLYPTRIVRKNASVTLDILFPVKKKKLTQGWKNC